MTHTARESIESARNECAALEREADCAWALLRKAECGDRRALMDARRALERAQLNVERAISRISVAEIAHKEVEKCESYP